MEIPCKDNTKYQEYIDNLNVAKAIQQGLLPKNRHFNRVFDEYFKLYIPRDIVSGDFYWVGSNNNLNYLVVGDCSGHGVSAAFISVLMLNIFEYVIMNKGIKKTHKILKEVDKKFIEGFKNVNENVFDNPWVDLSIVAIDKTESKIYFSGANRKLFFVKLDGTSDVIIGNRYPIGGWQIEKKRVFSTKTISFNEGDIFYLGSDGFQDQIGGGDNKKYKSKYLHKFLKDNSQLSLSKQKNILKNEFDNWKNNNEQTDDVCIVAVRL